MKKGFTLIELLVVISIIGILVGLSIFGLQGARESSRDAKRKSDLEEIRSALEIYKSDCNHYPAALTSPLVGDGTSSSSCLVGNRYLETVPSDPTSPNSTYIYSSSGGSTYTLCAALEGGGTSVNCGTSCGGTSGCNYKVINP